jgi:hypothetical protein
MSGSINNLNVILTPWFATNYVLNLNTSLAPSTESFKTKINNLSVSQPTTDAVAGFTQYSGIFGGGGEFTVTDTDFYVGPIAFGSIGLVSGMSNIYLYNCSELIFKAYRFLISLHILSIFGYI